MGASITTSPINILTIVERSVEDDERKMSLSVTQLRLGFLKSQNISIATTPNVSVEVGMIDTACHHSTCKIMIDAIMEISKDTIDSNQQKRSFALIRADLFTGIDL